MRDVETGLPRLEDDGTPVYRAPFRRLRRAAAETPTPRSTPTRPSSPATTTHVPSKAAYELHRQPRARQDEGAVAHPRGPQHPARRSGRGARARRLLRLARGDPRGRRRRARRGRRRRTASSPTSLRRVVRRRLAPRDRRSVGGVGRAVRDARPSRSRARPRPPGACSPGSPSWRPAVARGVHARGRAGGDHRRRRQGGLERVEEDRLRRGRARSRIEARQGGGAGRPRHRRRAVRATRDGGARRARRADAGVGGDVAARRGAGRG